MTWNKKLMIRRITLDLSRKEASELIGVNPVTYRRWENGESLPITSHKKMIAQAFEINELDIFGEDEEVDDE